MKKLIFIALLIAPLLNHAQSELVLNQVLLVKLTTGGVTVPAGKVWKVEHSITKDLPGSNDYFMINDDKYYVAHTVGTTFPIWLPAGTIVKSVIGRGIETLSVLEFNLVSLSTP